MCVETKGPGVTRDVLHHSSMWSVPQWNALPWTYLGLFLCPLRGINFWGMGWGFDCLCWPWGRAFDQSYSPGGGDIWIFLRSTWDRRGDGFDCRLGGWKRLRPNICFPTSTLHARDVRSGKIWKSWKPTRTSQRWVDFTVLINWTF